MSPKSEAAFLRETARDISSLAVAEPEIANNLLEMADALEAELLRTACAELEEAAAN